MVARGLRVEVETSLRVDALGKYDGDSGGHGVDVSRIRVKVSTPRDSDPGYWTARPDSRAHFPQSAMHYGSVVDKLKQTSTQAPDQEPETTPPPADADRRAVFRIPLIALLAVLILFACVLPVAGALPGLQVLLLIPVALAVWIIRMRTTATRQGLHVRTVFSSRHLSWDTLQGLAITPRSQVQAVLADGSTIALPAVRTRHLPVLALVSQGRIADPSGVLDQEDLAVPAGEAPAQQT